MAFSSTMVWAACASQSWARSCNSLKIFRSSATLFSRMTCRLPRVISVSEDRSAR